MAKVDWITWKTYPSEIINPQMIVDKLEGLFENYNTYMNPIVYETMKAEILNGGLSPFAFQISGQSPSNELAIQIIKKIEDIKNTYYELNTVVNAITTEQKEIEKRQLVDAIDEKINSERNVQNETKDEEMIHTIQNNIKKLQTKKDVVESL
jgi:hypothetical protein